GVSGLHDGMLVVTNPRVTALNKSSSVGKVPVGVERHLNVASVKSRGFGSTHCAFSPSPSPAAPWQPTQNLRYSCTPGSGCPPSYACPVKPPTWLSVVFETVTILWSICA